MPAVPAVTPPATPPAQPIGQAPPPVHPPYVVGNLAVSLDRLAMEVGAGGRMPDMVDFAVSTGAVAGVGYVMLNTRLLAWLLSLLLARPLMWKQIDPLEVLYAWEKEKARRGEDDDDDGVARLAGAVTGRVCDPQAPRE